MDPLEEMAVAAQASADRANSLLQQHIDDCGRRYDGLQRSIFEQFRLLGESASVRHAENQRRLDSAEESTRQLFLLILSASGSLVLAMAGLVITLALGGHIWS